MNKIEKLFREIELSDEAQKRILEKIRRKEVKKMKFNKKHGIVAVAAVLLLGIGAFASSGIVARWTSSSSSLPDYKSIPTKEQCIEDIGYAPILKEKFENGYTFKNGSKVDNALEDEGGNNIEKFKSVSFTYEKGKDTVYISAEKFVSSVEESGEIAETVNGTDIYYSSYMNKVVPPHYKLTDEDKAAEKNGDLVFSYGSPKVEIIKVQSACFNLDGIHYNLLQLDGKLTKDELVSMAKEIIKG